MFSREAKKRLEPKGEFATHRQGTFELAVAFVECSKKLDEVLEAKWWSQPLTFFTRSKSITSLRARINEVSVELGDRYKGVMGQLLQWIDPHADLNIELAKTWQKVSEAAISMNHKEFCTYLWHTFVLPQNQSKVHLFKPKFMLRQFVDEMEAGKDQGILIAAAYGPMMDPGPHGSEILKCLSFAYTLLHSEMLRHSADVEALTDHEFSGAMISSINAPYIEYEQWLFNSPKSQIRSSTSHGKR